MKVGILVNSLGAGGAERVASLLGQELSTAGTTVAMICLERDQFYPAPDGVETVFLSRLGNFSPGLLKLFMLPVFAMQLKKTVHRLGIDVIQSHLYRSSYVNSLARILGSPHRVQIVIGGQAGDYKRQGMMGFVNLLFMRLFYGLAEIVVVKSEGMHRDFQSILQLRKQNLVTVIHNPCDIDEIRRLAREEVQEAPFDVQRPIIICVGRLVRLKRHDDVIRAFSSLECGNHPPHLVFLGVGPEKHKLERLAEELGVKDRCWFLGLVANPFKYMARATCFVFASYSEGFPNVIVEALASGCPVISSDCESGPREILAPATDPHTRLQSGFSIVQSGILFAVGDTEALTRAINHVLSDADLRERLQNAGAKRCLDFNRDRIGEQYRRLLDHRDILTQ